MPAQAAPASPLMPQLVLWLLVMVLLLLLSAPP